MVIIGVGVTVGVGTQITMEIETLKLSRADFSIYIYWDLY